MRIRCFAPPRAAAAAAASTPGAASDTLLRAATRTRSLSSGYFWLPQFASFFFLFGYNETVKWFFRNRPDGIVTRLFKW